MSDIRARLVRLRDGAWRSHRRATVLLTAAAVAAAPGLVLPTLTASATTTTDAYASAVLLDAPLAYYRLDETSGTTMVDLSGNGNDGTYANTPTFGESGAVATSTDTATGFGGTGNGSATETGALPTSAFTVEFWEQTTDAGGSAGSQWYGSGNDGFVDGEVGGVTTDYGVTLADGKVAFGLGAGDTTIFSPSAVNDGNWHMVDATWDSANGHMWLYVDGAQVAATTGPTAARTATSVLNIGRGSNGSYLNGSMDEIAIYGSALSPLQVDSHYQAATGSTTVVPVAKTWDAASDTAVYNDGAVMPAVANPQADAYDDPDVWQFAHYDDTMHNDAVSIAPQDYALDTSADTSYQGAGAIFWRPSTTQNNPSIGVNKTGRDLSWGTVLLKNGALDMYVPSYGWPVLGWQAPENTGVSVSALLAAADVSYNNTRWYLLRADSSSASTSTELAHGSGSGSTYNHTESFGNLDMKQGQMLYLVVGPGTGDNNSYDSTRADLTVTQLTTTLAPSLTDDTGGATVPVGHVVTYTATVDNTGGETADATQVVDTIPTGLQYDAPDSDASCTPDNTIDPTAATTVTCDLGDIPAAGSAGVALAFTAVSAGSPDNAITVGSDTINEGADTANDTVTIGVAAPDAPSGLTAAGAAGEVDLSWTAPASYNGTTPDGYDVYRATDAGLTDLAKVNAATVTGTAYADTTATPQTPYYYVVKARSTDGGDSAASAVATAAAFTTPDAPTGLTASGGTQRISLGWSAPADGGSTILGYDVYRSTASDMSGATALTPDPVTGTSFDDTSPTVGTAYYYAVTAVNAAGESAQSAPASATAQPASSTDGGGGVTTSPSPTPSPTPTDAPAPCPWNGTAECYTFPTDGSTSLTTDNTVVMLPDGIGPVTVTGDGNSIDGLTDAGNGQLRTEPVTMTVTGNNNSIALIPGSTVIITGTGNTVATNASRIELSPGTVVTVTGDGNLIISSAQATSALAAAAHAMAAFFRSRPAVTTGGSVVVVTGDRNTVATGAGADQIAVEGSDNVVHSGGGADFVVVGKLPASAPAALRAAYRAAVPAGTTVTTDDNTVSAGGGADVVYGGPHSALIAGGAGDDVLRGRAGRDHMVGGGGNDAMYGGRGQDTLFGGSGRDRLHGGAGRDHLYPGN